VPVDRVDRVDRRRGSVFADWIDEMIREDG